MNLNELIAELSEQGVNLWVDGDQLRIRAPKGVMTPELRDELAEHKAELVLLLRQSNMSASATSIPLVPVSRDRDLPVSFAQQRLWFLDQLEPGSAFYNIPAAVRLQGRLNVRALEHSLNEIISRHETLRTNFATVDGQPAQVIASTRKLTLPVVDLRSLPFSVRLIETQRLATLEAQRPFDLATEPLVRATLLQVGDAEQVLLLTMHHIISDGWSMGVIVREVAALYEAFCHDLPSPLLDLPIQYVDYAVWQRQWLQGDVLESQLAYWKQQLEGAHRFIGTAHLATAKRLKSDAIGSRNQNGEVGFDFIFDPHRARTDRVIGIQY